MTKVCFLCDAGFKATPAKVGIPLVSIDGKPADGAALFVSPEVARQIRELVQEMQDDPSTEPEVLPSR